MGLAFSRKDVCSTPLKNTDEENQLGSSTITTDSDTLAKELKKICNAALRKELIPELWVKSLMRNPSITAFRLLQALMFISNNVAVNWFSLDKNWSGKLTAHDLLYLNILFALGTIISNAFSKVTDLGDKIEGLGLDKNYPYFLKCLWGGPQTTFILNINWKLMEQTYSGPNFEYVLVITQKDVGLFNSQSSQPTEITEDIPDTLEQALQLLRANYHYATKKELMIIDRSELNTFQQQFYSNEKNEKRTLVAVCSFDVELFEQMLDFQTVAKTKFIRVYPTGWCERILDSAIDGTPIDLLQTTLKAVLYLALWLLAKGLPGLVVLATGVVSFSYILGVNQFDSPITQGFFFFGITLMTWLGKVLVNNRLKGDLTELEIRRIIERLVHRQRILQITSLKYALPIIAVSLCSVLPYNISTAWFYTADGIETALSQFNNFTGTHLSLPEGLGHLITYFAVAASVPIAIATNSKPTYTVLAEHKKTDSSEKSKHAILWKIFLLATFLDGLKCGDNAIRNAAGTISIFERDYPSLAGFSGSLWSWAVIYEIAFFMAAFNVFFAIDRANDKFSSCMNLSSRVIDSFSQSTSCIFSRRAHTDPLKQSMLTFEEQSAAQEEQNRDCPRTLLDSGAINLIGSTGVY